MLPCVLAALAGGAALGGPPGDRAPSREPTTPPRDWPASTAGEKAMPLTRCNDWDDAAKTWAAVAAGSDEPLPLRSLSPPVLLPDGSEFKTWEQPADHRRTFCVAQKHPKASDDNPGTADRPWKTISRAAEALEPGDRVIVREGVYREWVRPARGGTGPKRMITYQAAPGEEVVIRGSERLAGPWKPSPHAAKGKQGQAWAVDLPGELFDGHNPFAQTNLGPEQADPKSGYNWTARWAGKPPFTLAQGLVFQDGRRLRQVAGAEDAAGRPGTYWVEPGGRRLHVRPFGDKDPNDAAIEVTTRPFAFAPARTGLGFIRCEGFAVEYVANCFPIPQRGAISTRQGHHWIIANNTVRQVNALGLDFGRRPTFLPRAEPPDTPAPSGAGHIVRGNRFHDCGICSMQGLGLFGCLVEGNFSSGCGWQRVEHYMETGGIKLHYVKHSLVRRNVVQGTIDAPGIWIDHSNANTRLTQNIVVGARCRNWGGIFFEASYRANMIDHNIVWDCRPNAFYQHDCEGLIVANNLFGNCPRLPVLMRCNAGRVVDIETNRRAACRENRVAGNVFHAFGRGPELPARENESDYNVFVGPPGTKAFDLAAWQKRTGREAHSATFASRIELSAADWTLRQAPPAGELLFPRPAAVTFDFLDAPRRGGTTGTGPFVAENRKGEVNLLRRIAGRAGPESGR